MRRDYSSPRRFTRANVYSFVPNPFSSTISNNFVDRQDAILRFYCAVVLSVSMKTYVINLPRRRDRLEAMSAQLRHMALSFERIPAIDAADVSDVWLKQYFQDRGPLGAISKGDQCCSLSHRRTWQAFVASGERCAAILEDDVVLESGAAELLKHAAWLPEGVDLVKLEHFGPDGQMVLVGDAVEVMPGRRIAPILSRHTGAAAYIISRQAAERLLGFGTKWSVPVDHLLFNPNVSDIAQALRPQQLLPAIARQKTSFGGVSDIRGWRAVKPSLALVTREIVRAYFELRLLPRQIGQVLAGDARLVRVGNARLSAMKSFAPEAPAGVRRKIA